MEDVFGELEDYSAPIKFRYLVDASQNFINMVESEDEFERWTDPEASEDVLEILGESQDYDELKENIAGRVSYLIGNGEIEDAKYVREFFKQSAENFRDDIVENPEEFVLSHVAFQEGFEYSRKFSNIFPDCMADKRIQETAESASNDYEFARDLRTEIESQTDDQILREGDIRERLPDLYWKVEDVESIEGGEFDQRD